MNICTSYRLISLLSVIAKTLERTLLPYITSNISMHLGFKSNYSTSTALHNINNTIATGFSQNKPPERTITVALGMSKAFDNQHTHINYTKQTSHTPLSNTYYIKGRKAYTTFRNKTDPQFGHKAATSTTGPYPTPTPSDGGQHTSKSRAHCQVSLPCMCPIRH